MDHGQDSQGLISSRGKSFSSYGAQTDSGANSIISA
jgi:hypothetical protein